MIIVQDGGVERFPRLGAMKLTWKLRSGPKNIPNKKKVNFIPVKKEVSKTLVLKPNQTKPKQNTRKMLR